jgi:tRNA (mo5U34)-methyltransferase
MFFKKKSPPFDDWLKAQVEAESGWFHKIRLREDVVTPGWSDPETEKLPWFGLPEDMAGMRVLDIGCAEGFFSFEAERRGAAQVVAIDSSPHVIQKFNLCRAALDSRASVYLCNIYDLNPKMFGTFDLVLFYGVLYHLRHPLLALERILNVCTGTLLLQTAVHEHPDLSDTPMARFHPHGIQSGPDPEHHPIFDPTVFWMPNRACVRAMVDSAGFINIETLTEDPRLSIVLRAQSPVQARGQAPDQMKAPWS